MSIEADAQQILHIRQEDTVRTDGLTLNQREDDIQVLETSEQVPTNQLNQTSSIQGGNIQQNIPETKRITSPVSASGQFVSVYISGSLECGFFKSCNDVYVKYSIVSGPDWILSSGTQIGITQIARYRFEEDGTRRFVWNQPISICYRTYNFYGWPQIVLSVYHFDTFGNDRLIGYGSVHLPVTVRHKIPFKQQVNIYAPQSSTYLKQLLSWITSRRPELVNSESFARGDCRNLLQVAKAGVVELSFNLTTKDVHNNGFNCG